MLNAILGASVVYMIIGIACSVWILNFFRPASYRPSIWIVAVSVVTFMTLWPFIVGAAICYLIGHIYRIRNGEPVRPQWRRSWAENDVKIPSIAAPRR